MGLFLLMLLEFVFQLKSIKTFVKNVSQQKLNFN